MRISDWSSDVCSSDLHLFEAADSAFAAHLTGQEAIELRRWLRGPEGGRRSRARGLANRIGELVNDNEVGKVALETVRSEEHTSELQSLMRISYDGLCLTKKTKNNTH